MNLRWDHEQLFLDGDEYFAVLLEDIRSAKELVTIEMYLFNEDQLGARIVDELVAASGRGVQVEVLVDGVGSYNLHNSLHARLVRGSVKVKVFNPLPFYHPIFGKIGIKKKIQALGFRLWHINRRDHRKIVTIDKQLMYIGSFNFSADHITRPGFTKWKDYGIKVSGEHVQFAVLHFKKIWKIRDYWRLLRKLRPIFPRKLWRLSPIRLNHSLLARRFYQRELFQKIRKARSRIWLTTPYVIPTPKLIRELGKAARRGVDVKLLISERSDIALFRTLQFFYYPYLLKKGVSIFEYQAAVLHAKAFIIDDYYSIGSSNLNHRSFLHDLEVDLELQELPNKVELQQDFLQSLTKAQDITNEHLKQRTLFDRFLSRLTFLFKYWF